MIKIYHNNRCKKSRAGVQYLVDNNIEHEVIEYLKNPISKTDLERIVMKLNLKPTDIVRTQEAIYKSDFKGKTFSDNEWIKIIIENPKLLKRPIIETNDKAVWGDPAENIANIL